MLLPLLGLGASLAGGAIGAAKSARAARAQQKNIDEQRRRNESWYNNEYYKDYMDRSDVQAAMERVRGTMQRANARAEQQAAVTGATPEAVIAQKEANAGVVADTAAAIQSNSSAHQDRINEQYRAKQDSIDQQQQNQNQLTESGMANLANIGANGAAAIATSAIGTPSTPKIDSKQIQDFGQQQAQKAINKLNTNYTKPILAYKSVWER